MSSILLDNVKQPYRNENRFLPVNQAPFFSFRPKTEHQYQYKQKMTSSPSVTVYRQDYTVPPFLVDHIDLVFDLGPSVTQVKATTRLRHNPESENRDIVYTAKHWNSSESS